MTQKYAHLPPIPSGHTLGHTSIGHTVQPAVETALASNEELVGCARLELATNGLKVRCSTD